MRSLKSFALAATAAMAVSASPALAADPVFTALPTNPNGWIVTVKGNAQIGTSYPGSDKMDFVAFPSFSFRRAGTPVRYSAPDDGVSFAFVEQSGLTLGVVGRYEGGRYLSSDRRLFGLNKIDWAVEPGLFVEYWPVEFLRARAEIRYGINGYEGFVGDIGLDVVQRYGAFIVSVGPRVALGGNSFTRTYFGVTPYEAFLNGQVTAYRPSGGITSVGATTGLTYDWSSQWSTTAFVTYKRLVGDAGDSPIVKRFGSENQFGLGMTVSYSFDSGL
ncbi:MipA/OmpV family protein [Microvirga antarctica]|uniref:MipA/OmpV family protein n=1 Tax=Microvirga antarctica TaxID=2819233 RepID=UPI001B3111FF|nr:MipA/OmpV family protein [Microvirga antarctica]